MQELNPSRRRLLRAAVAGTGAAFLAPRAAFAAPGRAATPPMTTEEMAAVEAALGKKGTYVAPQATYTTPLPRGDLKVAIQGVAVPVPFGFGGWVSVKKTLDGRSAVLMSDTVLLADEVNDLISAVHASGLEISAIHNHFFFEAPRIVYMHVHGMGAPGELARKYADAIRATNLFPANQPPPAPRPEGAPPARTGTEIFDLPALDRIVGHTGVVNGPTYKYTVGRDDLFVTAMGAHITAAIGLNTWASFAGTAEDAHIAGDVAMREPEVNPVVHALRQNGINVVALHNHMLGENPRIIFLHYYGRGPAATLARAFRAALGELGNHGGAMHSGAGSSAA